ncbi:MAG: carbonic anhydrase [Bacteroidales bacterium]|nr:carbonic anhydrase [Bacteroidales bacterium]
MNDPKYDKIFDDNLKWVQDKTNKQKDFFSRHYEEQTPEYLYIGCSDSRVPANEITGLEMGDLFVHRNIANVVANNDINMMSVLQYAVDVLEVKHIVVCGHYGCGGLNAAMQPHSFGVLDNWLRNVRDVYRFHKLELDEYDNYEAKMDRLAEINVEEQCMNVIKNASIQESYIRKGIPHVHGWIYDMRNGILKDLKINFEGMLKKVQEIYNLEEDVKLKKLREKY